MTFSLLEEERELLNKAAREFLSWLPALSSGPKLKRGRGSPGNHLGRVWVRIAARHWFHPKRNTSDVRPLHWPQPEQVVAIDGREPAAKNGRFVEAVFGFTANRPDLPEIGVDLIEDEIKLWREVGFPATRETPYVK